MYFLDFPHFLCWKFYSSNCSWQRVGYLFLTRINKIIWSDCLFFVMQYNMPARLSCSSIPKTSDNANAYYPIVIQTFFFLVSVGSFEFCKTVTIRYNYDASEWQRVRYWQFKIHKRCAETIGFHEFQIDWCSKVCFFAFGLFLLWLFGVCTSFCGYVRARREREKK